MASGKQPQVYLYGRFKARRGWGFNAVNTRTLKANQCGQGYMSHVTTHERPTFNEPLISNGFGNVVIVIIYIVILYKSKAW